MSKPVAPLGYTSQYRSRRHYAPPLRCPSRLHSRYLLPGLRGTCYRSEIRLYAAALLHFKKRLFTRSQRAAIDFYDDDYVYADADGFTLEADATMIRTAGGSFRRHWGRMRPLLILMAGQAEHALWYFEKGLRVRWRFLTRTIVACALQHSRFRCRFISASAAPLLGSDISLRL
jgi:hypothetical protein